MATTRSTDGDRQLGSALGRARKAAGFRSAKDVAAELGMSQSTISRVESGGRAVKPDELTRMLDLYQPADRAAIEALAGATGSPDIELDRDFVKLMDAEATADLVRKFAGERIPTALQGTRYMFKQHHHAGIEGDDQKKLARLHARRADLLTAENGPAYEALLSISSFLRMPGGDLGLVGEQAGHVLDLLDRAPNLTVRVLLFDADIPYLDTDFSIVAERGRTTCCYTQSGRDGHRIADKARIREREAYWNRAWSAALTAAQTRDVLRELRDYGPADLWSAGFLTQIG